MTEDVTTPAAETEVDEWYQGLGQLGIVRPLGAAHRAVLVEDSRTLLVTFERADSLRAAGHDLPLGQRLAQDSGVSALTLLSEGETWFRDADVYAYFDTLIDEAFFDDFDRVVFFGEGCCGYAAAAYSVAAPGAVVIALRPQATLDARVAEWDQRFFDKRRLNFTDRFGYAPDMLDAAEQAFIVYDPEQDYDAMHAALFTRSNVTKLRTRFLGDRIGEMLMGMGILEEILDAACEGQLTETVFNRLYRARRNYGPYLDVLLNVFDDGERPFLTAGMCKSVTDRMSMSNHRRRLKELAQSFKTAGEPLPFWQAKPTNATEVEGA